VLVGEPDRVAEVMANQKEPTTTAAVGRTHRVVPDADFHKGAIEDERRCLATNAPGLDGDGLPNDTVAIAADALGARTDGTQG
jgi:hypothetical protein